ncbi:acyltransferase family protein [Ferruginibacter paludis]|uniref:acyltransferase family protein n=1 Tax=Ferruginibacter paludis TaxID=1310417 RepID=UPI0025B4CD16|nr:acyltransferase [Ferruginibacter paludis]
MQYKIPPAFAADRLPALDGIRAVSISLVLFSHLSNAFKVNQQTHFIIEQAGVLGVHIFFVISGFLITTLLLKEKIHTGNISLKNFYIRRALRIFPVAFLYLFCMLLLNALLHLNIPLKCFLGAAFFMGNLAYFQGNWYTAHYWSLSIEEQYYLVFPLLLKKFTNSIDWLLIIAIFGIVFFRALAYSGHFPEWPFLKLTGLLIYQSDGVLMGSLLAVAAFKNWLPITFFQKYGVYITLILPFFIWPFYSNRIGIDALNPAIATLMIALLLHSVIIAEQTMLFRLLNNKYAILVGKLSFSLYIWQQLLTGIDGKLGRFAQFPQNLLLIALLAWSSYYFFERRFLRVKNKFH